MQGKATVGDHPVHPMLIPFPIAYFIGSGIADIVHASTGNECWKQSADDMIAMGIVGGLTAAGLGLTDYLTAPMSRQARRDATMHMIANVGVVGLYALNSILRRRERPAAVGYALSALGIAGLCYSGWLGGTLSYVHHVGAREDAEEAREEARGEESRAREAA